MRTGDGHPLALVIVNPVARNLPSRRELARVDALLAEAGWKAHWRETSAPGHATELAARAAAEGFPLVLVCGGDGTLREAASGLAGTGTALAPIPAGTVNIWARETGIPRRPEAAVRTVLLGERRRVDLGRADGHRFLLMAGVGLDGRIAARVGPRAKRHLGAAAYALTAVLESLRWRPLSMRVRADGQVLSEDALMLVAGNTRNYAGLVQVTPLARADDGLLDVCLFRGDGLRDIVLHALLVALGRHLRSSKVVYRQVRRLEIDSAAPVPVQLDGDPFALADTIIEAEPSSLWAVVRRGLKSPLFGSSPRQGQG
ncbi:MAG TPA: diacylglycerol kinase family protein [Dehalococcoidia bacterium]|nr:diacylglycerol kinase family protein [Dehalococcoidia bacterium]